MGVSKSREILPPKSILIGVFHYTPSILGGFPPIFGNIHMTCEFLLQKSQYSDPARWIRGMMWMFLFLVQISLFPHEMVDTCKRHVSFLSAGVWP